jgi:hypothetical protein
MLLLLISLEDAKSLWLHSYSALAALVPVLQYILLIPRYIVLCVLPTGRLRCELERLTERAPYSSS